MPDCKEFLNQNFITYASYVICERAIPDACDGLKPVQRRILHTLYTMDDGRFHKVANAVGQTMAFHPHGDSAIKDALVNLANKGFLLDTQGNFGNLFTGDPAAAARYIETRLSPLARATLFNPQLTDFVLSYDARHHEPVTLPCKIPLLLMQGAEGIAVGMSTRIYPHNFSELLRAQIAHLKGEDFTLLPDFPMGGIMDPSAYDRGRGKLILRAKIKIQNDKTLLIEENCYSTTTESLIRSIDEAAKRGRIKIDSIHDYSTDKVSIEIRLPRGSYAKELIPRLYAFTECEVSLNGICIVIDKGLPIESDVHRLLKEQTQRLQTYLTKERELAHEALLKEMFRRTLERIFIEEKVYKLLEKAKNTEDMHRKIAKALEKFNLELGRLPTHEEQDQLLRIPIRRISLFDREQMDREIQRCHKTLLTIEEELSRMKEVTIDKLEELIKNFAHAFPRKTQIDTFAPLDTRSLRQRDVKVSYCPQTGYLGTKVKAGDSLNCSDRDRLLLFFDDGSYCVHKIEDKLYVLPPKATLLDWGIADRSTAFHLICRDPKTKIAYAKTFIVKSFSSKRLYRFYPEKMELLFLSKKPESAALLRFSKTKRGPTSLLFSFEETKVRSPSARPSRISSKAVTSVSDKTPQ